jgi:exodeoxyribonuclease V beta subunit
MSAMRDLDVFTCPLSGTSLIEASAGTGKTWNICGIYLRLLIERELTVDRILVVTFTKAATAELRERIRARIVETLAQLDGRPGGGDPFVSQLLIALRARPTHDEAALRATLDAALKTFDDAAIFTIHGFCQRALAETPFAAGLPFRLDVTPDDNDLAREAVADFWRREIATDALSPELAAWLVERKDSPETWAKLLRRVLARPLARIEWPEAMVGPTAQSLIDAFKAAHHAHELTPGPLATLLGACEADTLYVRSYSAETLALAAGGWEAWLDSGQPLSNHVKPGSDKAKLRLFRASVIAQNVKKGKIAPEHPFFAAADALIELRAQAEAELESARLALIRRMLETAGESLRAAKRAARLVAYDDMLSNLHRALSSGENPQLAASLREKYPAALIDEFQDTDPVQFDVFSRIYVDDAEGTPGPLFLVGDPKQAIYSFRNADLHTYLSARQRAEHAWTLRDNQRSSEPLIEGLNALFNANPGGFVLKNLDYETVRFGPKRRPLFADESGAARGALQLWQLPADAEGGPIARRDAQTLAIDACAGEIARLIAAGQRGEIRIDTRALMPSDIAVLVRSHTQAGWMKAALAEIGVAAVEISQRGVFQSLEAVELARVLHAVREPARVGLLRAALATSLNGWTADELARLDEDEASLQQEVSRFADWRERWNNRGVGLMLRQWMAGDERWPGIAPRLLAQPDGERRMTNILHLGELLQQASEEHPSPEALLRWFADHLLDETQEEIAQLRLESDRKLVQIVTIHKSKGLEYPITFAPFLWDGFARNGKAGEGLEYHDETGRIMLDFRPEATADKAIKARRTDEAAAEDVRLAYVALTRVVLRSYVVVGCYTRSAGGKAVGESAGSVLNWLAAGGGQQRSDWPPDRIPAASIESAWQALAARAPAAIALDPLPQTPQARVELPRPAPDALAALPAPRHIPEAWRIGSFSRLVQGSRGAGADQDHDALAVVVPLGPTPATIPADDILHFPRGASAGDCLHAAFEHADFGDPESWDVAARAALRAHPQRGAESGSRNEARLVTQITKLLGNVCASELLPGFSLAALPASKRLTELGFHLANGPLTAGRLNAWLAERGYDMPPLGFHSLHGYLSGFIDLVFEHDGRYFLLDWKSNLLGFAQDDYRRTSCETAMRAHGYHLQYLLYTLALHRHLRLRLPDYDYERHIGGALYLFLRGVRPDWRDADDAPAGVYFRRPDRADIESLDVLIGQGRTDTEAAPLPEGDRHDRRAVL